MVRSLWTGATGMIAQQLNVDNISNNLANVNTTGYKAEVMEFKSLLYQTIQCISVRSPDSKETSSIQGKICLPGCLKQISIRKDGRDGRVSFLYWTLRVSRLSLRTTI